MTPPLSPEEERRHRARDERLRRQWNRAHGIEDTGSTAVASVFLILILAGLALFHPGAAALIAVLWVLSLQKEK